MCKTLTQDLWQVSAMHLLKCAFLAAEPGGVRAGGGEHHGFTGFGWNGLGTATHSRNLAIRN